MSAGFEMKQRLRSDLVVAMKQRRAADVSALRTLIAALDNAEAVPVAERRGVVDDEFVNGTAEVARAVLDADRVTAILVGEAQEREAAAIAFDGLGQPERAAILRAEAALARRYAAG